MARPRFHITPDDWFDTLDWLEYQLSQPGWLLDEAHPVHQQGLAHLTERLHQCRYVQSPTHPDCDALQTLLEQNLDRPDWDRLRKTLSARRRRRREKRLAQSPVNLTLTTQAHHWLKQLARAGRFATLSDALVDALPAMVADLEAHAQKTLKTDLEQTLASWTELDLIANADQYLTAARNDRSLATACRIAFQWYQRDPDRHKAQMLKERFIEDLVWNQIHLGKPATAYLTAKPITQNAVGAGRIPDNEL
ncbi:hypothetical protein [Saccharospirillum alexandrii]|uniref:hypothetical protein n=1 Tax=Saccharospirillum alexandrii TaxID=2448477 RepID=UPI0037360E18